jgi:hypothetical protein
MSRSIYIGLLFWLGGATNVAAQDAPNTSSDSVSSLEPETPANIEDAVLGFVAPDAPALTALGASNAVVERPGNTAAVGAALANLITADGKLRTGLAMEITPRAFGFNPTTSEYLHHYGKRVVSRLALSVATVSETQVASIEGSRAARLGIGVRLALWDQSDPYLLPAYKLAVAKAREECRNVDLSTNETALIDCLRTRYEKLAADLAPSWNGGGLVVALAQTLRFENAELDHTKADTLQSTVALALPLEHWGQVNFAGAYVYNYSPAQSDLIGALRIRVGGASFRGAAEIAYFARGLRESPKDSATASLGFEIKVNDTLWLQATVGGDLSDGKIFSLGNIKWDTRDSASFKVN